MIEAEPGGSSTDDLADRLLAALDSGRQLPPPSAADPTFDLPAAYRVAAAIRRRREARGEIVIGRKIGFTNTTIWAEYDVHAPIWGYVYDSTLHELGNGAGTFELAGLAEPRIEPEIAFGLSRPPEPGMDERALLGCVDWVAHGFEIVQSQFPGWRFAAADTAAGFGLHGALLLGPRLPCRPAEHDSWFAALADLDVTLRRDGAVVDRGHATNVLGGGPLAALRHLVDLLGRDPAGLALAAGEIVTTGTLTRAFPVVPGETWSTAVAGLDAFGLDLPGLRVSFG